MHVDYISDVCHWHPPKPKSKLSISPMHALWRRYPRPLQHPSDVVEFDLHNSEIRITRRFVNVLVGLTSVNNVSLDVSLLDKFAEEQKRIDGNNACDIGPEETHQYSLWKPWNWFQRFDPTFVCVCVCVWRCIRAIKFQITRTSLSIGHAINLIRDVSYLSCDQQPNRWCSKVGLWSTRCGAGAPLPSVQIWLC